MDAHRVSATLAASLVLAIVAPEARAAPPSGGGESSVRIPYSDLDLTTDEGLARLYGRVRHAARLVCGSEVVTGSRIDERQRTCLRAAIAQAVRQLGVPGLAELHRELESGLVAPPAECQLPAAARPRIII
jgi:UrcA family protein